MPKRRKKAARVLSAIGDLGRTALEVVKESSDAFPPLKSAAGFVQSTMNISQKLDAVKTTAARLSHESEKAQAELDKFHVDEAQGLSDNARIDLATLEQRLQSLQHGLTPILSARTSKRMVHLQRDQVILNQCQSELDDIRSSILVRALESF
ncbi:hypothetical protein DL96DRAFT_1556410 [Flagelloscypha sp. PMI_526]|nr:hypothetical protein DL96DRAFT_1556410 [Flagelloscypha sp. PMI_526]